MKVITPVVNNPFFIEIQYYTLKKYLKCVDGYEFIVFNDAKDFPDFTNNGDVTIKTQIEDTCKKLNIQCINIPNYNHRFNMIPSIRTADSCNFMLEYQKENPDKYLILDSDMFLVDEIDFDSEYAQYNAAVLLQTRFINNTEYKYIWNGIAYFDMERITHQYEMDWNLCNGCDTGGMMKEWLSKQTNVYYLNHMVPMDIDENNFPKNLLKDGGRLLDVIKNDPRNENGKFFIEIIEDKILHYRGGGDWERKGLDLHFNLSKKLAELFIPK